MNLAVPCTYYQRLHHLVDLSVVGGSSRQWHLWQSYKPHLNVELYGWSSDMAYGESMSSSITILDAGGVGPWKPREWWRDTSPWSKLVHFSSCFYVMKSDLEWWSQSLTLFLGLAETCWNHSSAKHSGQVLLMLPLSFRHTCFPMEIMSRSPFWYMFSCFWLMNHQEPLRTDKLMNFTSDSA